MIMVLDETLCGPVGDGEAVENGEVFGVGGDEGEVVNFGDGGDLAVDEVISVPCGQSFCRGVSRSHLH